MFLSIIIPIHNSANHLHRCLDSIWSQQLSEGDYEVICVDDCSTDSSYQLLLDISTEHNNLIVIKNKTNIRAGGARNRGVKEARGEYILFIDSDDYFHPDSLRVAYEYQKIHCLDILMLDSSREQQGKPNNFIIHNFKNQEIMTGRLFMIKNSLPYAPWKYIFKKSLMVDNNVWFEENVNCEDVDWTHKLAFYAKKMQYLPLLLTHYVLLPLSETGAEYKNINTIRNRFYCGKRVLSLSTLYTEPEEQKYLYGVSMNTYNVGLRNMCGSYVSPLTKYRIIEHYFLSTRQSVKDSKGLLLNWAFYFPYCFSVFSTIISPFARLYIVVNRLVKGR